MIRFISIALIPFFILMMDATLFAQSTKWQGVLESTSNSTVYGLAADHQNNTLICGSFKGEMDFDLYASKTLINANATQQFLAKYDTSGIHLWNHTSMNGGVNYRYVSSGLNGRIFLGGFWSDSLVLKLPSGNETFLAEKKNNTFIQTFSPTGELLWSNFIRSKSSVPIAAMDVNPINGDIAVLAYLDSTAQLVAQNKQVSTRNGRNQLLIWVCDSNGNFKYSESFDYFRLFNRFRLRFNPIHQEWVIAGNFRDSIDVDPGNGTNMFKSNGNFEPFFIVLDTSLTVKKSFVFGTAKSDVINDIQFDSEGNIFALGEFGETMDLKDTNGNLKRLVITSAYYDNLYLIHFNRDFQVLNSVYNRSDGYFDKMHLRLMPNKSIIAINEYDMYGSSGVGLGLGSPFPVWLNTYPKNYFYLIVLDSTLKFRMAKSFGNTDDSEVLDVALDNKGAIVMAPIFAKSMEVGLGGEVQCASTKLANGAYAINSLLTKYDFSAVGDLHIDTVCPFISYYTDKGVQKKGNYYSNNGYYQVKINSECAASNGQAYVMKPHPVVYVNLSSCDTVKSPSGKYKWVGPGTFKDTFTNVYGCDSIIVYNLSPKTTSSRQTRITCLPIKSPGGRHIWTLPGIYRDTIRNQLGCDSFMEIEIKPNVDVVFDTLTTCSPIRSFSNKTWWEESGVYVDTLTNKFGCDSIIHLKLTVLQTKSKSQIEACDVYISPSGKHTWTSSGTFYDTLVNKVGCDSIIQFTFHCKRTSYEEFATTECIQYYFNGKVLTQDGVYYDTLKNSVGCDSLLTLYLTIAPVNTTISKNDTAVFAGTLGAKYQWLNCNNQHVKIDGAANRFFKADKSGSYAVEVSENQCIDTSDCLAFYMLSGSSKVMGFCDIFPNPTKGPIQINCDFSSFMKLHGTVYDACGRLILDQVFDLNQVQTFNKAIAPGIYNLILESGDGFVTTKKLVVH